MQEKKLLRDALEKLLKVCSSSNPRIDYLDDKALIAAMTAEEQARKALSSTTEEMEMEKLVAWLGERSITYPRIGGIGWTARIDEIESILKYITTQFGEEEGE